MTFDLPGSLILLSAIGTIVLCVMLSEFSRRSAYMFYTHENGQCYRVCHATQGVQMMIPGEGGVFWADIGMGDESPEELELIRQTVLTEYYKKYPKRNPQGRLRKATRITITSAEFEQLIVGHSIERDGVEIALEDMGFEQMVTRTRELLREIRYDDTK